MSFQLTRTHTSVVLAATTIAASLVVIPTLAEGTATSEDAFCNSLSGAEGRITAEYNPLLASYAAAAPLFPPPILRARLSFVQLWLMLRRPSRPLSRRRSSPLPRLAMPLPQRRPRPIAASTGLTGLRSTMPPRRASLKRSSFRR